MTPLEDIHHDFDDADMDMEPVTPIIRDFFEHIRSEGLNEEDREEWSEFSPAARGVTVKAPVAGVNPVSQQPSDEPEENVTIDLDGLLSATLMDRSFLLHRHHLHQNLISCHLSDF